ncbi:arsenite methyltransferase [Methanolobus sp. ZRKC3]|uniref:arsenite methyltransferase n=1 Tax=Methanolobus sp. ZRKC3 TaxID=3125786 RepID=UPI00324EC3E1
MDDKKKKTVVKESYGKVAIGMVDRCCCSELTNEEVSSYIGYSDEDIKNFSEANLGLGCGSPTAFGKIDEGAIVLDLGSGAGFDTFLAAQKVGESGKVIGVDMTEDMIVKARKNAENYKMKNVEFRLGDIEKLPVDDESIDIVISNCVINLAPEKTDVFKETYRVLKKGGRAYVSDMVLLKELSPEERSNEVLLCACIGGALLKDDYIQKAESAGFSVKILGEDTDISQRQYMGYPIESLKLELRKENS